MPTPPRLLYVVTEDWYFLSHRLPMARAAREAGFEVHVATRVTGGGAAIAAEGFALHPVAFERGRLGPGAGWRTVRALRALYRELAPDVAHHVSLQCTLLGSMAASGLPMGVVNAVTGLGYAFTSGGARAAALRLAIGRLLRVLLNRGRGVALVQNPDDRALLEGLGVRGDRIALIPGSGVDVESLQPAPEPPGAPKAAFVGRLLDDKGIRTLIEAHRMLRRRGSAVELLIAGTPDPANRASVSEAEAQSWNALPGVSWLGHVADISGLWARAHIAALPSRREGLPKSLLEAAACGRPMVATDVPGCREVAVADETGLLVPPDDAAALADAIERLAGSPELRARMGANARRMAVERFSAEAIGRQTVDLYRRLAGAAA